MQAQEKGDLRFPFLLENTPILPMPAASYQLPAGRAGRAAP